MKESDFKDEMYLMEKRDDSNLWEIKSNALIGDITEIDRFSFSNSEIK
jgi:hypothetical protein